MTEAVKKNGITFGIILAVYFVLRIGIMYAVDLSLFTNKLIGIADFVIGLAISIVAISKAKSAMGGFISFKHAFTVYFLNVLIGLGAYTLFTILLFNIIDPAAGETVHELTIETTVKSMQGFGVDTAQIKQMAEGMKENNTFSLKNQLIGFPIGLAVSCIIGLIVAAIMKKNKPEFE